MIAVICAMLGGAIILTVVAVAVLGWAGLVPTGQRAGLYILAAGLLWAGPGRFLSTPGPGLGPTGQRAGLYILAAGLLWAGPGRFLSQPGPGLGDLLFLAGIGTLLVSIYGRALIAHIEGMDGRQDGRLWPFS